MTLQQPNEEERANIAHVLNLTGGDRQHHRFDFRDERQYRHAVETLLRVGKTPERYPGLHEMLRRAREEHIKNGGPPAELVEGGENTFVSGPQVTNAGLIRGNLCAGSGYHTEIGGTSMTQVVCQVVNTDNSAVLAAGSGAQYNAGTFVPVQTDDTTARSPAINMTASVSYYYQKKPGDPMVSGQTNFAFKQLTTSNPTVEQPVKTQALEPLYIFIGLGRGVSGGTANVDYWFWQKNEADYTLAVPLVGNVTFDAPIQTLDPKRTITLFADLAKKGGGHKQPSDAAMANVYSKFTVSSTNNKMLTWNLPSTGVEATTNPIVFGLTDWASNTVAYMTVNMFVNLVGHSVPSYASIQSVDQSNMDPINGTTFIRPIKFAWHCLAGGTGITMADGSTRKIETLVGGETVRTDNAGGTMTVDATFAGPHRGPALKLTMTDGKELILSEGHALLLPDGEAVIAEELEAGEALTVLGATAKIARVEKVAFEGVLFNLSLIPADGAKAGPTTMFANGILVGDHTLQSATEMRRRTRPERVRAAIDPIFLKDYESFLEDTRQASGS